MRSPRSRARAPARRWSHTCASTTSSTRASSATAAPSSPPSRAPAPRWRRRCAVSSASATPPTSTRPRCARRSSATAACSRARSPDGPPPRLAHWLLQIQLAGDAHVARARAPAGDARHRARRSQGGGLLPRARHRRRDPRRRAALGPVRTGDPGPHQRQRSLPYRHPRRSRAGHRAARRWWSPAARARARARSSSASSASGRRQRRGEGADLHRAAARGRAAGGHAPGRLRR